MAEKNPNDVTFAVTGMVAVSPRNAVMPTPAQMDNPNFDILSLPGWVSLGLRESGAPSAWADAPATPVESYEEGYKFSPRNGTVSLTQTLIENSQRVAEVIRGVTYNYGGSSHTAAIDVDKLTDVHIFTQDELIRPDNTRQVERYMAPLGTVTSIVKGASPRGQVKGTQVTMTADRDATIGGFYLHTLIDKDATPDPVIVSVLPAGQQVSKQVVISGRNFTGMTGVTVGGTAVVTPLLVSDDTIVATLPAGTAGANKPIIVTTPNGPSVSYAYTVAA